VRALAAEARLVLRNVGMVQPEALLVPYVGADDTRVRAAADGRTVDFAQRVLAQVVVAPGGTELAAARSISNDFLKRWLRLRLPAAAGALGPNAVLRPGTRPGAAARRRAAG
jgi:hypothetical protein